MSRTLRIMAALAACLSALSHAQQDPPGNDTPVDAPLVGVHYQDLLPGDGDTIDVYLPRLLATGLDGVMLSSSAACAGLGSLADLGPEHVMVLEVELRGADGAAPLAPGDDCAATIVATYSGAGATWSGATRLHVHRLEQAPIPPDVLAAALTLDRVQLPFRPGGRSAGTLVTLRLTNVTDTPVVLLGFADPAGVAATIGLAVLLDGEHDGTLEGLERVGRELEPTAIAPGASVTLALVPDPDARLPDGSGVITAQVGLLVDVGGSTRVMRFERLSTAWGNQLP